MLSEELRFHRLNLDSFKTPYIQHCILEMSISDVSSDLTIEVGSASFALHKMCSQVHEMTEDISKKNLEIRTEVFLKDEVFPNISNSISVLHHCETLLPVSEEVNLVSQLINSITNNACKEQLTSDLSKLEYNFPPKPVQCVDSETPSGWWEKSLVVLNLDLFQRVLSAVKIKGLKQDIISKILINYAQLSLKGLFIKDPQLVKGSFLDLDL
ncbi:hypothetical protein FXO38_02228 [Capsicum annuum]|uniref:NPH3 domain-containing protein n=1 Tax=Capsicum annuum TaxID=4072 RepID=A0A2G2YLH4_CAPAN|nr:hypothetical protein FXO38_02228 [Capsicum annuum]KAF3682861.1 hypothetical protein FXO37_02118 [Capsicum annuum]PHT70441.1 hypothetical protein T459_25545 [Capsicum annuum]